MVYKWLSYARISRRNAKGFDLLQTPCSENTSKKPAHRFLANVAGSAILALMVFVVGLFLGAAVARADDFPIRYVSLEAKVVLFPGETESHGYQRISRIVGEANKHILDQLIQIELVGMEFVPEPSGQTMYSILRDLVTASQGNFGTGTNKKIIFLFTTQAYGGQEGLAMLGSGCTDFAAGVVASKSGFQGEYPQNLIVSAGRTLAHEFLHVWGAAHSDRLVLDPETGNDLPSLMHAYAVGSFQVAQESVDQIRNYLASIPPESYCLRENARNNGESHPPVALSSEILLTEGNTQNVHFSLPGLPPDFQACSLEVDDQKLPFSAQRRLVDAVSGDYALSFALDTLSKGQEAVYGITVKLTCSDYTSEQLYQIRLKNRDLSPIVTAPRTNFTALSGRSSKIIFTAANPDGVAGKPSVRCSLPRGTRLYGRNGLYYFTVRPSRTTAYSCVASNAEGNTDTQFQVAVVRPLRSQRR